MLATGLSFAAFGVGGFLLGVIAVVVIRVAVPAARRPAAVRRLVSAAFRAFARFMAVVGVMRWRLEGREHWSPGRRYLVVANHPSLIDIVFLIGLFDGADCIVKGPVLRNPAFGRLARAADYVSNDDTVALVEEATRRVLAGRTVVLFPEGTRTEPGQPLRFGNLAAAIAVRAGCEVLPVVIRCEPPTLYKGLPWYRVPARQPVFTLQVCPAWPVAAQAGADRRQAARALTARLAAFFTAALATAPAQAAALARPATPGAIL